VQAGRGILSHAPRKRQGTRNEEFKQKSPRRSRKAMGKGELGQRFAGKGDPAVRYDLKRVVFV